MSKDSKTAVVTGASSRFGAAYARRRAERGDNLILVGRNERRIRGVADEIVGHGKVDAEVFVADLSASGGLAVLEERLRTDDSLDMLVNAAGAATFAPTADISAAATEEQIALNVTAPTRLSTAALSGMRRRGRGTTVNISSAMAFWIQPASSVYSATQSYVLTFTQALQQELADTDITVQAVIPGAMSTGFWKGSGSELSSFPAEHVRSPEDAVDAAPAGLDPGEAVSIPSLVDVSDWRAFEQVRDRVAPIMSRATPADRYLP